MARRVEEERPWIWDESCDQRLRRAYRYARRGAALLGELSERANDEDLTSAEQHFKCVVYYLKELRKNGVGEEVRGEGRPESSDS